MEERPTFNVELARRVLTYISEHPRQHDQYSYVEPKDEGMVPDDPEAAYPDVLVVAENVKPTNGEYRCMTTACIAGWAVTLAGPAAVREACRGIDPSDPDIWFETGRRLLGMSRAEAAEVFLETDDVGALELLEGLILVAEQPAPQFPTKDFLEGVARRRHAFLAKAITDDLGLNEPGMPKERRQYLGERIAARIMRDERDALTAYPVPHG